MDHAFVIPKKSEDPTRVWGGFDLISLPLRSVSSAFLRWENEDTFFFFLRFYYILAKPLRSRAGQPIFECRSVGFQNLDFSHRKVFCIQKRIGCYDVRIKHATPTLPRHLAAADRHRQAPCPCPTRTEDRALSPRDPPPAQVDVGRMQGARTGSALPGTPCTPRW